MQRYFVSKVDDKFKLLDSDFHHVKDVMRIPSGGNIICVYEANSYLCEINYTNNTYDINIIKTITKDVELPKDIILYQALIKNDKFDLVIQKATELGVANIVPTIFARSIIKIDNNKKDNKLARYNKIIKEACEQSHREILPSMSSYLNVLDIKLDKNTLGLIAFERNGNLKSFNECLKDIDKYDKIAIVIGPEGGFEEKEVSYLESIGFKNISLGKRILRSETASMYAISVIANKLEGE